MDTPIMTKPDRFVWEDYIDLNSDLSHIITEVAALDHYNRYGKFENRIATKGKTVLCAMARNEDSIIVEWVLYYLLQGIDLIHIIDDYSITHVTTILAPLMLQFPERIKVDRLSFDSIYNVEAFKASSYYSQRLTDLSGNSKQLYFYNWFANEHWDAEWLGFLDIDEFVWPGEFATLKALFENYKDCSHVIFNWLNHSHNYHVHAPEGLAIANFTLSANYFLHWTKYFCRPQHVTRFDVHYCVTGSKVGHMLNSRNAHINTAYSAEEMDKLPHVKHYMMRDLDTMIRRRYVNTDLCDGAKGGNLIERRELFSSRLQNAEWCSVHSSAIYERYGKALELLCGKKPLLLPLVDNSKLNLVLNREYYEELNGLKGRFSSLTEALLHYIENNATHRLEFT